MFAVISVDLIEGALAKGKERQSNRQRNCDDEPTVPVCRRQENLIIFEYIFSPFSFVIVAEVVVADAHSAAAAGIVDVVFGDGMTLMRQAQ